MKLILKTVSAASLAAVLGACAGGGGAHIPASPAVPPKLSALNPSDVQPIQKHNQQQPEVSHSNPAVGQLKMANVPTLTTWGSVSRNDKFIYQTADGKQYALLQRNNLFIPTGGINANLTPTKVRMSETEAGDKFVVCCDDGSRSAIPSYVGDHSSAFSADSGGGMRYGVWISRAGQVDMFYGGTPAEVAKMQGAADNGGVPTGKATYEVIGLRVRNGQVMASTHDTKNSSARSLLVVNFNNATVGGTIRGNADFGDDIVFGDVKLTDSNRFSGNVRSGSVAGQVDGRLYGIGNNAGDYIGGRATFSGHAELDSVFGGAYKRQSQKYTGDDLIPE